MKILFALTLLFSFIHSSFSQSTFKNGYVLLNDNSRVEGLIESKRIPTNTINFKTNEGSQVVSYSASEVQRLVISNYKTYVTRNGKYFQNQDEKIYCELLVEGEVSLLSIDQEFFVQKGDTLIKKLESNTVEKFVDGKSYQRQTNEHIGILKSITTDCPEIQGKIDNAQVNENSLTKVIVAYNECKGGEVFETKKGQKFNKLEWGPFIGLSYENFAIDGNEDDEFNFPYLYLTKPSSTHPVLGLEFNIFSERRNSNLQFNSRIVLSKESFSDEIVYQRLGHSYPRTYKVSFEHLRLRIPLGVKYKIGQGNSKPYLRTGLSYSLLLNKSSSGWAEHTDNMGIDYKDPLDLYEMKSPVLGFWAGTGVAFKIKKHSFFTDVEYKKDLMSYDYYEKVSVAGSSSFALTLSIGYLF